VIYRNILCIAVTYTALISAISIPPVESYGYDQKYHKISDRKNQSTGVMVVAFNRPEYLKELLASIEKNPESKTLPFYFMLDGGTRAKQEELSALIKASPIKHKYIIARERNYGCAKNHIDGRRFMFDWCNYKRVIEIEEDVKVSPHYFKVLLNLDKWARERYANVGMTQCFTYCFLDKKEKEQRLQEVAHFPKGWWSLVTFCYTKEVWDKMKPVLYEYETRFVDKIPLTDEFAKERSQPGYSKYAKDIRAWARSLLRHRATITKGDKQIFPEGDSKLTKWFKQSKFMTNQDVMMGLSLWLAGYIKLQTIVNRAMHIGEVGLTYTPELFELWKHSQVKLDIFKEDATLKEFKEVRI
jgi:hypothetical protein